MTSDRSGERGQWGLKTRTAASFKAEDQVQSIFVYIANGLVCSGNDRLISPKVSVFFRRQSLSSKRASNCSSRTKGKKQSIVTQNYKSHSFRTFQVDPPRHFDFAPWYSG